MSVSHQKCGILPLNRLFGAKLLFARSRIHLRNCSPKTLRDSKGTCFTQAPKIAYQSRSSSNRSWSCISPCVVVPMMWTILEHTGQSELSVLIDRDSVHMDRPIEPARFKWNIIVLVYCSVSHCLPLSLSFTRTHTQWNPLSSHHSRGRLCLYPTVLWYAASSEQRKQQLHEHTQAAQSE